MKNTLALALLFVGGMLIVSGYQDWTLADTMRFLTGQPLSGLKPGTVAGTATAVDKDRPGYAEDQLQKNEDGSFARDSDGYIILKPGATPFDPTKVVPKPGETVTP